MSYFRYFPNAFYKFGDNELEDFVQNISVYADIIDQIRDDIAFYEDYYIQDGERPDQVSFKIYDTPNYHWTFFILNNKLREFGWPLRNAEVVEKVQKDFNGTIISTFDPLIVNGSSILKIGDTIENPVQSKTALITGRDINKGYLKITPVTGTFVQGDLIRTVDTTQTVTINSVIDEYNSVKYYENASREVVSLQVDSDAGLIAPGSTITPVTYQDYYLNTNDDLRQIKVIRPNVIAEVVSLYREALEV